jgi:hypothetical protein
MIAPPGLMILQIIEFAAGLLPAVLLWPVNV